MPEDVPENQGEMRRRAAWLLGMLALVAVLIVIVMSFVLGGGGSGNSDHPLGEDPITRTAPPSASTSTGGSSSASGSATSSSAARSSAPASSSKTLPAGAKTCSGANACTLPGDTGNALAAINALRADNDKGPITGKVTDAARTCALKQGSGCPDGFAQTELASPDGSQAVKKISEFADFLAPGLKTIQLGWAYDPGSKTYYFATIQAK